MNISISIQAPELVQAIQSLATSLTTVKGETLPVQHQAHIQQAPIQQPAQHQAPIQQVPVQQPAIQQQPMNMQTQPQGVPTAPPVQQQPPAMPQAPVQQQPQGVPTSAPTYTMDQLAVAATQLMDAGRQADLLNLLAAFGAASLMQLPKEQYGTFATKLREMGAKI